MSIKSIVVIFFSMVILAGCGTGTEGPALHPVKGSVVVDGKAAVGAVIVFHPVDASQTIVPSGEVDETGEFALITNLGKGAPAGDYKVSVVWNEEIAPASSESPAGANAPIMSMSGSGGEAKEPPKDRLNGKYSNPDTSGLKCSISSGNNELAAFELKADGPSGPASGSQ